MNMKLKKPSVEQKKIIKSIKGNNIIIEAVAGAGKTTTFLHIMQEYYDKTALLLTYNAKLKDETREKARNLGLHERLEIHSFHAFAKKYLAGSAHTDTGIRQILQQKQLYMIRCVPRYDFLMIDECQDMTSLYYELICRVCSELCKFQQVIVVGDKKQCIFQHVGSDLRYITYANELFQFGNSFTWKRLYLKDSFRITEKMAMFINKCMYKEEVIYAKKKQGAKPKYIVCDAFQCNELFEMAQEYLKSGYNYDDIFILAPSVKTENSPVRKFANMFTTIGIPIYIPMSEEEQLDPEVLKNKIVFSTFHQVKGLERKIVIVFCFDDSYFKYYATNQNPQQCPNILYVATTRASEELILIHNYKNNYIPFLDVKDLDVYCDVIKYKEITYNDDTYTINKKRKEISVTNLLRNLPETIISEALKYVDIKQTSYSEELISIPVKTKQDKLIENVSEINGTAIPLYFQWKYYKKFDLEISNKQLQSINKELIHGFRLTKRNVEQKIKRNQLTISDMLRFTTFYNAITARVYFKTQQIQKYDWIRHDDLEQCMQRMRQKIVGQASYEIYVDTLVYKDLLLYGYIDCIDQYNIWEFKCVGELTNEHKLQLALYMYLYKKSNTDFTKTFYIWNILTNEQFTISSDLNQLEKMVEYLIEKKYFTTDQPSDAVFLSTMQTIRTRKQLPVLRFL